MQIGQLHAVHDLRSPLHSSPLPQLAHVLLVDDILPALVVCG